MTGKIGLAMLAFLAFVALAFITVPILSLFLKLPPDAFFQALRDPEVVDALLLSLLTATISTVIVLLFGTPIAYLNAHYNYPGKVLVDTITDMPAVLPPAVAGLALLLAFGQMGVVGHYLAPFGISIAFTTFAVILAQVFVSSPFYIRQARASFQGVDREYEEAARTMGSTRARTFLHVTLPLASGGLVSGAITSWARALGEFGATILFAGNLQGRTQTMPLAIYSSFEGDISSAVALSMVLVIISFGAMVAIKLVGRKVSYEHRD
jgi:molybdate transport system permease protein